MIAYSYQQNVFPIYSELRNKTNEEYKKVSKYGLPLTACIYFAVGTICIFMFGESLTSQVLENIGDARQVDNPDKGFWEGYMVQVSFMIVLMCHIPFIFYSGKEGMLIIIDEIQRRSISNALWHKLQTNKHFSALPDNDNPPNPDLPIPGDEGGMTFGQNIRESQRTMDLKTSVADAKGRSKA